MEMHERRYSQEDASGTLHVCVKIDSRGLHDYMIEHTRLESVIPATGVAFSLCRLFAHRVVAVVLPGIGAQGSSRIAFLVPSTISSCSFSCTLAVNCSRVSPCLIMMSRVVMGVPRSTSLIT